MLQQTQVGRVIPTYHAFVKRFPTVQSLAKATQADVIKMWHGLGYNRRAVMLRKAAIALCAKGSIRSDFASLIALPGIGEYTAHAIRAFAFHTKDAAPVDTNIERILKRVFGAHKKSRVEIQRIAKDILPTDVWGWNHALMDLGATVCTARKPSCETCPLKAICRSYPCAGDDVKKRPQPKFANSDRMFRGRIVARLRGKTYDVDALQKAIELPDDERFGAIVDKLIAEGLIRRKGGKLLLT